MPALAVLLLGAAGCGGDDGGEEAAPTTAAPAPTTSGPTTTTIQAPEDVPADPSGGCDASTAAAAGEEQRTIESGGIERWYIRHVPAGADGRTPQPLVLDLHGYAEGAVVHVQMSQLGVLGDQEGFVTVTPHGTGDVVRWDTSPTGPDVAFLAAVLDEVEADVCIDRNRVHVAGLSNGAMMTSTVTCALADRVASVAPVAGVTDVDGCELPRPVPMLAIHGTADTFVAYEGGLGEAATNLPAPDGSGRTLGELGLQTGGGPSIPEIMAGWAERNGCEPAPDDEQVADDVVRSRYPCPEPVEVELYTVIDGGHAWPGSALSQAVEGVVGRTTTSISASELMWQFFQRHPRR